MGALTGLHGPARRPARHSFAVVRVCVLPLPARVQSRLSVRENDGPRCLSLRRYASCHVRVHGCCVHTSEAWVAMLCWVTGSTCGAGQAGHVEENPVKIARNELKLSIFARGAQRERKILRRGRKMHLALFRRDEVEKKFRRPRPKSKRVGRSSMPI